jgi:hypothetical protein
MTGHMVTRGSALGRSRGWQTRKHEKGCASVLCFFLVAHCTRRASLQLLYLLLPPLPRGGRAVLLHGCDILLDHCVAVLRGSARVFRFRGRVTRGAWGWWRHGGKREGVDRARRRSRCHEPKVECPITGLESKDDPAVPQRLRPRSFQADHVGGTHLAHGGC